MSVKLTFSTREEKKGREDCLNIIRSREMERERERN